MEVLCGVLGCDLESVWIKGGEVEAVYYFRRPGSGGEYADVCCG